MVWIRKSKSKFISGIKWNWKNGGIPLLPGSPSCNHHHHLHNFDSSSIEIYLLFYSIWWWWLRIYNGDWIEKEKKHFCIFCWIVSFFFYLSNTKAMIFNDIREYHYIWVEWPTWARNFFFFCFQPKQPNFSIKSNQWKKRWCMFVCMKKMARGVGKRTKNAFHSEDVATVFFVCVYVMYKHNMDQNDDGYHLAFDI